MININECGFTEQNYDKSYMPARVTAVHKERYEIVCEEGMTHARLKSAVYFNGAAEQFPTTGDFVLIQHNPSGDSLIVKTLPRRTFFSRRDPTQGRGEQAVAANFDFVFIMQSLNHDFNPKRLERYITLAWQSDAQPMVVLTKADLQSDYSEQMRTVKELAFAVPVIPVSAKTGYGLDALREYLQKGKTAVLLGSSGVGKSSLVNALAETELMSVSSIREDDSRGRHTTTHRQLIMLDSGAMIIDTPGMRELGMWDVSSGLKEAFEEIEDYIGKCRFSDCHHETEPGCAIKAAIEAGEITEERWQSYVRLKKEARYSDDKQSALREKEEWHKSISKINKQRKKI